jgi:cell division inhibitor SepF
MANVFKKAANYLGLVDQDEELELALPVEEPRRNVRAVPHAQAAAARPTFTPAPVAARPTSFTPVAQAPQVAPVAPVAAAPVHQEVMPIMDQIFTIHPRFYNEARNVGERYREGQPVLMNLTDMDESERKRLVDFASGLVFGHHGSIERVTSKVFLLTPPNVRVSTDTKAAAAEASFFNQS